MKIDSRYWILQLTVGFILLYFIAPPVYSFLSSVRNAMIDRKIDEVRAAIEKEEEQK